MLKQLSWEIDTHGLSVCTAFEEYYSLKRYLLRRRPHLLHRQDVLRLMIAFLMERQ